MNTLRVLLKLSGEVLKGKQESGICWDTANTFCNRIASIVHDNDVNIGIVIGGGNIFRGASGSVENYDRLIGDNIGMLATVINGLALVERLRAAGVHTVIQSGIHVDGVAGLFNRDEVESVFSQKGVVVFSGGLGNPYFSTDTTCALRSIQIEADYVFKATKVDGVYDKDPVKFNDAVKYDKITYDEVIDKELEIMDLTAMLLLKKHNMKLRVFNMNHETALEEACQGKKVGTEVLV